MLYYVSVFLKSCRKEKKIHDWTLGSLDPAAIQFALKRLQESARQSECCLLVNVSIGTLENDLYLNVPHDISLFIV